jgi:hypothetical protein
MCSTSWKRSHWVSVFPWILCCALLCLLWETRQDPVQSHVLRREQWSQPFSSPSPPPWLNCSCTWTILDRKEGLSDAAEGVVEKEVRIENHDFVKGQTDDQVVLHLSNLDINVLNQSYSCTKDSRPRPSLGNDVPFRRHRWLGGGAGAYADRIDYSVLSVAVITLGLIMMVEVGRHSLDIAARNRPFFQSVLEGVYTECKWSFENVTRCLTWKSF